ncbi:MAG: hypothetical protein ACI9WS_000240 [Paraglaciecola psychrophila]|jgi:hypothetical protein
MSSVCSRLYHRWQHYTPLLFCQLLAGASSIAVAEADNNPLKIGIAAAPIDDWASSQLSHFAAAQFALAKSVVSIRRRTPRREDPTGTAPAENLCGPYIAAHCCR